MNSTIPHYELLPLLWWENPWVIGSIFSTIILVIALVAWFWHIRRIRTKLPLSPLDQWLLDLRILKQALEAQQALPANTYDTLVHVLREYARVYHLLYHVSSTDEEFVELLKRVTPKVPSQFLELAHAVTEDAYQVKFANVLFPLDYVDNHITTLIAFLEQQQHNEKINSQNKPII